MRNLFDQYQHPENRLTHALASALQEDRQLLTRFVAWASGGKAPPKLSIVEQRLPGGEEISEEEAERLGLPDAWIHDDTGWCLLIESKVAAPLKVEQLQRHIRTAQRRGFEHVQLLALDTIEPRDTLPSAVLFRQWRDVYAWLCEQAPQSDWAKRVMHYMETAEAKWAANGYLKEGTMTVFAGIPFGDDNPYSYLEAKRVLKLSMEALRQHPPLLDALPMDPQGAGRAAIKGKGRAAVWDLIRLEGLDGSQKHTAHPHLTFSIMHDHLRAMIIVPNGVQRIFRRRIVALGPEGFFEVLATVTDNMQQVLETAKGAYPFFDIAQRHFLSQSAPPTKDAVMHIDLRTAFEGTTPSIKCQPQWLDAGYDLISNKRSNLEFAVGAAFPYATCPRTRSPDILQAVADSFIACKPLLDVMLQESTG